MTDRILTPEEQAAIVAEYERRKASGDANRGSPRLTQVIKTDISGRRYFEYEGDISVWFDQFKGPAFEQIRIAKTPVDNQRFLAHWLEQRALGRV